VHRAIIVSPLVVVGLMRYVVVGMMVCACKLKMGTEKIAKEILLTGCDPSWSTFLRYCNISKKLPYSPGHKHHRGISNIG